MKTIIRLELVMASTFMVIGNLRYFTHVYSNETYNLCALTASGMFLVANTFALLINLKPKG